MMLKEMMNTRQAVKSVEGYNTLSRREQDKIAGESGLLICWIFGPMLLLIPLYFLLPEAWFENCLGSATFLSIAGLFVGLYQVEKNRQIQDEGSAIGAALVFFFVVFGFGCLWQVHFLLAIAFAAALIWYAKVYITEADKYNKYIREVKGKFIGYYCRFPKTKYPEIVALFKIHGIKRMDVCIYKEPMLTNLPYQNEYERLTKQMEAEQGAYAEKLFEPVVKHFLDVTGLEIGKTYTLKQHPVIRSKISYLVTLTDNLSSENGFVTTKEGLSFFDAAAPIVTLESINMERAFRASRYGRGEDDYINCPMTEEEYNAFYDALITAETAPVHGFENNRVFEGCMPVEVMAARGRQTLAFGPLKPVGLADPRTGKMPYAVLQLRQDDAAGTLYNLAGFQTRLKFPEQRRGFGMIPGLEHAEFPRYGVMHRNTFLNSPQLLDDHFRLREGLYFAGQMTGVEGYIESAASGMLAGISMWQDLCGKERTDWTDLTVIGAMGKYISTPNRNFQPMNATFGVMAPLEGKKIRVKKERYAKVAERSLEKIAEIVNEL